MWLTLARRVANPFISIPAALIVGSAIIGGTFYNSRPPEVGTYVAATLAPIQSANSSSATIVAGQNTDLSFLRSGQVASVLVNAGSTVTAGQPLVELSHADLDAALAQAEANIAVQQAKLAALSSGTRPEQLAIDQTAVAQAQSALRDAIRSGYVSADDAVHNKADQFFTNARTSSATLSITIPDSSLANQLQNERIALEPMLAAWSAQIGAATFAANDPAVAAKSAEASLRQVAAFLDDANRALGEIQGSGSGSVSATTISGYITSINAARVTLSTALSTLTADETALVGAQGTLALAQAGATANDVKAAQAAVLAAQAAADTIRVQITQTVLTAPIAGVVTSQNAHVGQTVSPGVPLVSLTAEGSEKSSALIVPSSAVYKDGNQSFVYVKDGAKQVKTNVQVGIVGTSTTEILSGLAAGQEVLAFHTN